MIVSVNLNTIPFLSSTDSTRASMSAKQIQQALTSLNCEIPYVIGSDYRTVTDTSKMGIILAKDDGEVIYKNYDIMIVKYNNLNKVQDIHIPPIKKTSSSFGTKLRFALEIGKKFQKDDILAEYDCFINGVPSYGYNVFTAYLPWFGFNHEDALVISESLSKKTLMNTIDKVYIPIYEYTLMQELYNDVEKSYTYFPSVGQTIKNDIVACVISPRESATSNSIDLKNRVQMSLKNMSLSNLLSFSISENSKFLTDRIKSKLINGKITGI
jgi:DNA-directed RNA polymerase, beta subunit/140 kD subunit